MEPRYRALLIGNSTFPNDSHNLQPLEGPVNDIALLRAALTDPGVGLFAPDDVRLVPERTMAEILIELETFFAAAGKDDQLLLYYSGHGLLTLENQLLLCARDTRTDVARATAVGASAINSMIDSSAAGTTIILLDCCYSGSFKSGSMPDSLRGSGRFLLTSCRGGQLANDADRRNGTSLFTQHVVEGLLGATPDSNGDGYVDLTDVYDYVYRRLRDEGRQLPQRNFAGHGEIAIARRPPPAEPPTPLPTRPRVVVAPAEVAGLRPTPPAEVAAPDPGVAAEAPADRPDAPAGSDPPARAADQPSGADEPGDEPGDQPAELATVRPVRGGRSVTSSEVVADEPAVEGSRPKEVPPPSEAIMAAADVRYEARVRSRPARPIRPPAPPGERWSGGHRGRAWAAVAGVVAVVAALAMIVSRESGGTDDPPGAAGPDTQGIPHGPAGLESPQGMVLDAQGTALVVVDEGHGTVVRFEFATSGYDTIFKRDVLARPPGGGPPVAAEMKDLHAVAIHPDGDVVFAADGRIYKGQPKSEPTYVPILIDGLKRPVVRGLAFDREGNLLASVGEDLASGVYRISPEGVMELRVGTGVEGFGGDGGEAAKAQIKAYAIATDADGNLFIADGGNRRLRQVRPDGTIVTIAGNGTSPDDGKEGDGGKAVDATLVRPAGVTVAADRSIFVADGNTVRVISPEGIIRRVAGDGSHGFSGDKGVAITASLSAVSGVTVDSHGNVHASDTGNGRVRWIRLDDGTIETSL